jgi:hypothetical protein
VGKLISSLQAPFRMLQDIQCEQTTEQRSEPEIGKQSFAEIDQDYGQRVQSLPTIITVLAT